MRFAQISALIGLASAATPSICDKYTTALLKDNTAANQYTLLKLLVNTALIGNFTGPGTAQSSLPGSMIAVEGILAANGPLVKYFDGSFADINGPTVGQPGNAIVLNFLDGGGATPILKDPTSAGAAGSNQNDLIMSLWSYFGVLLGCSMQGGADFPAYSGNSSMYNVHKYMKIDESELTYFIEQVGNAALSFGASKADATAAGMALNSAFGMRCSPPVAIVKSQPAELQAICIASDCPLATDAVCASYGSAMPSSAPASPVASAPASQISDGQVQATTAAPAVSQISDGQVQATTAVSAFTGAAAMPTYAAHVVAAAGVLAAAMV